MLEDVMQWLTDEGIQTEEFEVFEDIFYPSKALIIKIHAFLIKYFRDNSDSIADGEVKEGNIDFATYHVQYQIGRGPDIVKNLLEKAAWLMNHYFTSHTFTDGNKRTSFVVTLLFLAINLHPLPRELPEYQQHVAFFKRMAAGKPDDENNIRSIYEWLRDNSTRRL